MPKFSFLPRDCHSLEDLLRVREFVSVSEYVEIGATTSRLDRATMPWPATLKLLNAYFRELGLNELTSWESCQWQEIDKRVAHAVLTPSLSTGMAYGRKLRESTEASAIATEFLGLFGDSGRYLTNWEVNFDDSGRAYLYEVDGDVEFCSKGADLFGATFESGVVGINDVIVGILWTTDED